MNNMAFNPVGGLTDSSAYPTAPATEAAARAQIQDPSNQIRDFINTNFVGVFNTQNLSSNGYQKLPNGLILQWGTVVASINSGVCDVQVFYPVTFPSYCFCVNVTGEESSGGGGASLNVTRQLNINAEAIGLQAFNIRSKNVVDTYGAQATFKWLAVGC